MRRAHADEPGELVGGPQRQPPGRRHRRGRDVPRVRHRRARRAHPAGRVPGRRRGGHDARADGVDAHRRDGQRRRRQEVDARSTLEPAAEKGGYEHFMHKEIHEQPEALADALRGRLDEPVRHRQARRAQPGRRGSSAAIRPRQDHRLRHDLLRRPDRRQSHRGDGAHPVPTPSSRQRVPVPQPGRRARHAVRRRHASRARRSTRSWRSRSCAARAARSSASQRRGQRDRPGVRRRDLPARRPGDRASPPLRR